MKLQAVGHAACSDAVLGSCPFSTQPVRAWSTGRSSEMKPQCPPRFVKSCTSWPERPAASKASRYLSSFSGITSPSSRACTVITLERVSPRGS